MRTIEEVVKEIKNIHELETELKGKITPSKIPMLLKEILEIGKSIESVNGDLISRSATIKALEEGAFVPDWNLALAQAIVSKQPTAYNDGWIPCSERLPEDGGYYLVVYHDWSDGNYLPKYDDVRVKVMHYQVKDLATGYSGWNYPRTIGENADLIEADQHREVTHWKSLPSLPYQPKGE